MNKVESTLCEMFMEKSFDEEYNKRIDTQDFINDGQIYILDEDNREIEINSFKFLNKVLKDYAPALNKLYETQKKSVKQWFHLESFAEVISKYTRCELDNTYNYNFDLSRPIEFCVFRIAQPFRKYNILVNRGEYIALAVSNSSDVRGSYSNPKIFEVNIKEFMKFNLGAVQCSSGHSWDIHGKAHGNQKNLSEYKLPNKLCPICNETLSVVLR